MRKNVTPWLCFAAFLLMGLTSAAYGNPKCSESLSTSPSSTDILAPKVVTLLDLSIPYSEVPEDILSDIESVNLEKYFLAELFVLKYIYQRADVVQPARIFLQRLDQLEVLNRLYQHPDIFGRSHGQQYKTSKPFLSIDPESEKALATVTREAFFLALLSLANRHPFLILQDLRIIPLLTEAFFAPKKSLSEESLPKSLDGLVKNHRKILAATDRERASLLRSPALKLSARSQEAIDKWSFWLKAVVSVDPNTAQEVLALIKKLDIRLEQSKLPPGGY